MTQHTDPGRRRVLGMAARSAAVAGLVPACALAQSYPSRPVRLLVPVSAGGGTDMIARVVADQLSRGMNQPWVVENQGGAGGQIASQATARAEPDGYNLMIGYVSTHGTLPALRKVPYDPIRDFTHIAMIGGAPNVLVAQPSGPASFEDFLAEVRAHPGKASYASAGVGTITHLVFEGLKLATNTSVLHVPYRGIAPGINDMVAGQVQYAMPGLAGVLPYIRAGKLRALAVTGPDRHPLLPEVRTLKEIGIPHFEAVQWVGIMGPAHLPPAVVRDLSAAVAQVLGRKETADKLAGEGIRVMPMSQPDFSAYVVADLTRWRTIVRERGLQET